MPFRPKGDIRHPVRGRTAAFAFLSFVPMQHFDG
jgi:hypothetical protein